MFASILNDYENTRYYLMDFNNKETNLRQAETIVRAEGILSEKNLEKALDKDNKPIIKGDLVLQIDDLNTLTVSVYVSEKKNDGNDNPAYAGIETVMNTYKAISEVGVADATRVRFNRGQLRPNTYFDQQGIEKHSVRYSNSYFNSLRPSEEFEPKADFEVEVVISSIRNEIYTSGENQGEETGRAILECWLPTYNGIEPLTLIAPAEDGVADAVTSMFEKGNTVKFFGNIINSRIVRVREVPVVIGKPKREEYSTYVNELVITGASAPYEEDKAYNLETIGAAVAVRNEKLKEMKDKAVNRPASSTANNANAPINKPSTQASRVLPF